MRHSPAYSEMVAAVMAEAGYSGEGIEALLAIDIEHFQFVRRVMRGVIPQALMEEIGSGLDASQFEVLAALIRIRNGFGRKMAEEPTVGLLAEELCIDPSRASRVASELVERGMVQRGASQTDGRKSILLLTEQAEQILSAFLIAKWKRKIKIFEDWSDDDLACFARLFARYSEGMRRVFPLKEEPAES